MVVGGGGVKAVFMFDPTTTNESFFFFIGIGAVRIKTVVNIIVDIIVYHPSSCKRSSFVYLFIFFKFFISTIHVRLCSVCNSVV